MIIKNQKYTRNYLLLKKGGFRLYNSYSKNKYLSSNFKNEKNFTVNYGSNEKTNIDTNNKKIKKGNEKDKEIINTFSFDSKNNFNLSKHFSNHKLKEYKKHLFLKNILMSEKNYLLEDYMKHKEIELVKNYKIKNKKKNEAKKIFFSDNKINDNRTSYFYKECLFDEKTKFPLMIRDIQSNFILLKNRKYQKYKNYYLLKKLESEKNDFKDFNDKIGIKNIFIKSDKVLNKNKTFMNNNFFRCSNNYFTFYLSPKESLSPKISKTHY